MFGSYVEHAALLSQPLTVADAGQVSRAYIPGAILLVQGASFLREPPTLGCVWSLCRRLPDRRQPSQCSPCSC